MLRRFANMSDQARHEDNVAAGRALCVRCDGTGNELYSMYRACEDCGGTGCADDRRDTDAA